MYGFGPNYEKRVLRGGGYDEISEEKVNAVKAQMQAFCALLQQPKADFKTLLELHVRAAEKLGFVSLGFSGHASQGFGLEYSMTAETQRAYFETVRALGSAAKLRVWAGLEQDTFAPDALKAENRRAADYVIGSAHYVSLDFHGRTVAVDGEPALLRQYIEEKCGGDALELARQYFDVHVSGLLRDRPDIIGH